MTETLTLVAFDDTFSEMDRKFSALEGLIRDSRKLVTDDDFELAWKIHEHNGARFQALDFDHPLNRDLRVLRDKAAEAVKRQAHALRRERAKDEMRARLAGDLGLPLGAKLIALDMMGGN